MAPRAGDAGNLRVAGARAVGARHLRRPEARARGGSPLQPEGWGSSLHACTSACADRGVRFSFNTAIDRLDPAIATVIATPATSAARLLAPHAPAVAARISAIRIAPLVTVTMFFDPHRDDVRGFGVLFPRASGVRALGALFNTDIFAGRGPVRSETWIVGDRDVGMTTLGRRSSARGAGRRSTNPDRAPRRAARRSRHAMAPGHSGLRPHDRRPERGARCAAGLAGPRGQLSRERLA